METIFSKTTVFSFLCLLGVAIGYGIFVEPFNIRITHVQISDESLSRFFEEYKTILLSDVHATRLGIREKMVLSKIEKIDPDLVLLAGDYVSWSGNYEKAIGFLSNIQAREGVFAVMGDSDYQDSRHSCRFCHSFDSLNSPPVRFLRNERLFFDLGEERIALTGLEMLRDNPREAVALLRKPPGGAEIVLSQKQVEANAIAGRPVLFLSGDTHGGQVFMPDALWRILFGKSKGMIRKGLVKEGNTRVLVTSGIGTSKLPLRFLCPPEIVLFE